jgi:SH3-like domain-containing protein
MKIRAIGGMGIALLLLWPVCAEPLCVNVSQANVRSGPGTQYELVWQVYKYMPFEKAGTSVSGQWYAVKDVDGDVNWLHKGLVTSSFRCAVVKESSVNVRKGPGTRFSKASWGPAKQYDSFRVIKKSGSWVKVKDEWGEVGWLHKKFLWMK